MSGERRGMRGISASFRVLAKATTSGGGFFTQVTINALGTNIILTTRTNMTIFFRYLTFTLLLFSSFNANANDGAFYMTGNQLIPINETQVRVVKEVLKIKRIESNLLHVTVDYTFHNPGDEKEILVGFEANSPSGDVNGTPRNGEHPYMKDFKVIMNDVLLDHEVAIVDSQHYFSDGKIRSISEKVATSGHFDPNCPEFDYVYYFNTRFKKDTNTIRHEYIFQLSGSVELDYNFDYVLTAANRWADGQIEDFTLILDLGDNKDYNISRTFFSGFEDWSGAKRLLNGEALPYSEDRTIPMRVLSGDEPLVFKKLNFKPYGELAVWSPRVKSIVKERMAFIDSESNFRTGPTTKSQIKFQPLKGTEGTVVEREGNWIRINLDNGDSGWAHKQNLQTVR